MNDLPPWDQDALLQNFLRLANALCGGATPPAPVQPSVAYLDHVIDQMELQMMGIRP